MADNNCTLPLARGGFRAGLLAVLLALAPGPAPAFLLDWDAISWPAGSLSNQYNVDGSPGDDIRLFFSGNTNAANWEPNGPISRPVDGTNTVTAATGGRNPVEQSLEISLDWPNDTSFVTLTVQFIGAYSNGVVNVAFTLFDIDSGSDLFPHNWVDRVTNIWGFATNGARVAPSISPESSTPSFTVTTNNFTNRYITANSGTGVANTNNFGNAIISFNGLSNVVTGFTFTYGNNAAATTADPSQQHINLHDIAFEPVPEPGALLALAAAGAFLPLIRRRNPAVTPARG